jgi:predicted ATPase
LVVFDDIQWGEDTFLDLVEGVALLSAGAAILLVCMARPDLLDRRAQWPVSIRLEPLAADVVAELIGDLSAGLRERITVAAGGNPLFLTEMLAMAEEAAIVEVPPTLRALLAARLDQLDAQERRVLEGGAVEGEIFHRGAVQALAPEEPQVTPRLAGLVRRELIRPDRAQLPGEDGFRFRHVLIRDAAYDALPKGTRAELHTRFADWLQQRGADLVELDEILGYHLEKASAYEDELGRHDAALAGRAGGHLLAAGRRALLRDDAAATVSLLSRAAELVPADDDRRPDLLTDLATALAEQGALEEAKAMLADGAALARVNGNSGAEWRARVARLWWASGSEDLALDAVEREAQEAVRTLEALGDARFAGKAWRVLSDVYNGRMEGARWQHALERALEHARRAGDQHEQSVCLWFLSGAMFYGPAPVDEVLRRHEELSAEYAGVPLAEAALDRMLGLCRIQRGEFAEARGLAERARQIWRERGRSYMEATLAFFLGALELMAQDLEAAERELRSGFEGLVAMGEIGRSSTLALILARVLALQGRAAEAEELLLRTEHGPPDSPHLHIRDAVLARVRADRGEGEEAERLARCAVAIVERTDYLNEHGDALYDLAEVLQKVGKHEESHAAFAEAARLYQQKGNLVQAAWARARMGSDPVADRVAT